MRLQPIDSCMARNISFITLDHLQSIHYIGSSVKNVVHSRDGFSIRSYNFGVIEAGASILGPTSLMSTPENIITKGFWCACERAYMDEALNGDKGRLRCTVMLAKANHAKRNQRLQYTVVFKVIVFVSFVVCCACWGGGIGTKQGHKQPRGLRAECPGEQHDSICTWCNNYCVREESYHTRQEFLSSVTF